MNGLKKNFNLPSRTKHHRHREGFDKVKTNYKRSDFGMSQVIMTNNEFDNFKFTKNTKVAYFNDTKKSEDRDISNVVAIDFDYRLIAVNPNNRKYENLEELQWHTCERVNIVE